MDSNGMPMDASSVVAAAAAAGDSSGIFNGPAPNVGPNVGAAASHGPVVGGGQQTAAQNGSAEADGAAPASAYPESFMSVMKAMQDGEVPPGIQQVDDRISVDAAKPSTPSVPQPPKPWQQKKPQ
jgi:hypothetical protein